MFQVHHHTARHVLACTCLREESIKCVVAPTDCLVTGHLAIWLNAVLEAKELPASISNLDTTLTKMKAEDLTHLCKDEEEDEEKSSKLRQIAQSRSAVACRVM